MVLLKQNINKKKNKVVNHAVYNLSYMVIIDRAKKVCNATIDGHHAHAKTCNSVYNIEEN